MVTMTSKVLLLYLLILISATSVESNQRFSMSVKFMPEHSSIECESTGITESTKKKRRVLQQEYLPTKALVNATTTELTTQHPSVRVSQHHGTTTKDGQSHQAACRHPHSTPLVPPRNVAMGIVSLGGQPFQVILDTGSTLFWVFGARVGKARKIEMGYTSHVKFDYDHHFYDEHLSDDFKLIGDKGFRIKYGDGCVVTGRKGTDTLTFGHGLGIKNMEFGIADTLGGPAPQSILYDGIMGLGYSRHDSKSFARMINSEDGFLGNAFSVYMSPDGTTGEFMFGGSNEKLYRKPVHFARVVQPPAPPGRRYYVVEQWLIEVQNIGVSARKGFKSITLNFEEQRALVDTGSSHIHLPYDIASTIFAGRERVLRSFFDRNSKYYGTVPCNSRHTLPSLTIRLGGGDFELTGMEYTAPPSGPKIRHCRLFILRNNKRDEEGKGGGVVPMRDSIIIGGPFFRKYYTIFAGEGSGRAGKPAKIGFALAVHPGEEEI